MNKKLLTKLNKTKLTGKPLLKSIGDRKYASTGIPFLDTALSGKLKNGGISHGLTIFAAPSKHFKTSFLMVSIASWQKEHPEGLVIFYDSESGSADLTYFKNFGVDVENVLHVPIGNIEELTNDIIQKLDAMEDGDEVFIAIDSVGNLPSKREMINALTNNEAQDMTRAKVMKSMGRLITPQLNKKLVPCVAVNHVYDTLEQYSKTIMSGGTGLMLSANNVIFITRSQNKDKDKELMGYNFNIIIDKSRTIKEKSKFPITVNFDEGIEKYSGVFEHALKFKFITSPKKGWYNYKGKNYRKADILSNNDILQEILDNEDFVTMVEGSYTLDVEVREKAKEVTEKYNVNIDEELSDEDLSEDDELLEDLVDG